VGCTTTDDVALNLLALDPYCLEMPAAPRLEQLHNTRVMLDEPCALLVGGILGALIL